ncbi:MAG: DinB family protein [Paracoccaceae bacterium]
MMDADPCRPYRQLARNNALANRRLHLACALLGPGEWEAPRVSFFPSLKATLNHILVVDRFYLDALAGGTLGYAAFDDEEPCADVASLALAQGEMDAQAVALCEGMVAADLGRQVRIHRGERVQVESLADTLMHLFLHDQHHRGQVHAMLAGTSVKPPQLDEFFMTDDAAARVGDLSAVGRDEGWLRR